MVDEKKRITPVTYLDVAEYYLRREARPLSAREIVALAIKEGRLHTEGLTPWQTMKAKLSVDILSNGEGSRFKRVFQALFALREYDEDEYTAQRFIKNKLDEDIAVIDRARLTDFVPGVGFYGGVIDRNKLASAAVSMRRREAEERYDVVQLVSVFVVVYQNKFLTHMRSGRLPESRLHGEYSIMLGGHLAVEDFAQLTLSLFEDDLADCSYILRELSEELILTTDPMVQSRGFVYDDTRSVSTQHLGLVYSVRIQEPKFKIGERGFLMHPKLESIEEIIARRQDFENWSWLLMDNIEALLGGAKCL